MLKVELSCLQGLADLVRIEGPFLNPMAASDPEGAAVMLRLLLAHMASTSKRVMLAISSQFKKLKKPVGDTCQTFCIIHFLVDVYHSDQQKAPLPRRTLIRLVTD